MPSPTNINDLMLPPSGTTTPQPRPTGDTATTAEYSDEEILEHWKKTKRESIDTRHIFVRQWHHHILYFLSRHWIEWFGNGGGWRDKRLALGVPRPVTNLLKKAVDTIRALFTSVQLGVMVRPNGADPKNVAAAATADELAPLLHDAHHMNQVLNEFDFWLIVCGNAFLYTFLDYDLKYGTIQDPSQTCAACGQDAKTSDIAKANGMCPDCGKPGPFTPALDEEGQSILNERPKGRPVTIPLSPLELAFSNAYPRWEDLPSVTRVRWRTKTYYENHADLKALVPTIKWERGSGDLSLQLFKSIAQHNDLGLAQQFRYVGSGSMGMDQEDGVTEYEVHVKPCDPYPKGLVYRIAGDPGIVLHLEETEAIPGPLPYSDADGTPLFTFTHAAYEHVGGRILGAGPFDIASEKNDQLNQLDSMFLMSLYRTSNPAWLVRKGSEPFKLTGLPGLVIKYDDPFGDGRGKPERLAGIDLAPGWFTLRQQYMNDFEDLVGTRDIMSGSNPPDVNAFSALQLLDERSKGRFIPVLQARADAYKDWCRFALELEREFGPDERTKWSQGPARSWTLKNFQRTQLNGSVAVVVESGSTQMKTTLGMRAALDHAVQMKFINPGDPDQQYQALILMGLTQMVPAMDIDVQSALQKQQAFEDWANSKPAQQQSAQQLQQATEQYQQGIAQQMDQYKQQIHALPPPPMGQPAPPLPPPPQPQGPPPDVLAFTPLKWQQWYSAPIHLREFLKWANGDSVRQLIATNTALTPLLEQHLQAIRQAMPPPPPSPAKVTYTMTGPDLADPQVRQGYDRAAMLPPGDPSQTPPRVGTVANPQVVIAEPARGGAMERSNTESTSMTAPMGFKESAQNHGPI